MQTKYAMKAVFSPNAEKKDGRSKYTFYPEKLFNTYEEAEEALDGEYGDTLAQAATIDSENEEDLKGYFLLYIGIYEVVIEKQWGTYEGECAWCLNNKATTSYIAVNSQDEWVDYQVCAWCEESRN